jgi:glycerophosphoryl diester phosphodiesterase
MPSHRLALACALTTALIAPPALADGIELGPRPLFLVDAMPPSPLKDKLLSCAANPSTRSVFSIGHRGAPLMFPEHTVESNRAAARMGAGILECDVTFTKDRALVCRHAQNDLHTSTNILATPLASTCITPFTPPAGETKATAECRTSELTLAEFQTLTGKMDAANADATTVEAYMDGTAPFRTDLYSPGTLMTHAESIILFRDLGAKFTPELKASSVEMPFEGFTQEMYAQALIDDYKAAGIPASDVWPQSFNLSDIQYWIENEPDFGAQAVYLDDRYEAFDDDEGQIDPMKPDTFKPTMAELHAMGVRYIAPPTWMLVTVQDGKIVPSPYAVEAKAAGLNIITWTLERSGLVTGDGGFYYQSIKDVTTTEGVVYELLDVLAQDVGVRGIFSDWPATVTYYANCMGL